MSSENGGMTPDNTIVSDEVNNIRVARMIAFFAPGHQITNKKEHHRILNLKKLKKHSFIFYKMYHLIVLQTYRVDNSSITNNNGQRMDL